MHKSFIMPYGFHGFADLLEEVVSIEKIFQDKRNYKNYPPTDIVIDDKNEKFIIDLTVAGWEVEELKVQMEGNDLFVTGTRRKPTQEEEENNRQRRVILNGIAKRDFKKDFTFNKFIQDIEVSLKNGMLRIVVDLKHKSENLQQIEIKNENEK